MVGNRSKRGRPDPDADDPVQVWQEEARWSSYTRHFRWPYAPGPRAPRGRPTLPGLGAWLGIALVVLVVFGTIMLGFWALSKILP